MKKKSHSQFPFYVLLAEGIMIYGLEVVEYSLFVKGGGTNYCRHVLLPVR